VITYWIARAPELMQITWQTAGRAEHHVSLTRRFINRAYDGALTHGMPGIFRRVDTADLGIPRSIQLFAAIAVGGVDLPAGQRLAEHLQGGARVGHQWQPAVLEGVELGDVDINETDFGILERRLRGGCEVAVTSSDADDEVRLAGDNVRAESSGDANRAEVLRMVVRQRTFAGLRFADRNARRGGEL